MSNPIFYLLLLDDMQGFSCLKMLLMAGRSVNKRQRDTNLSFLFIVHANLNADSNEYGMESFFFVFFF